MPDPIADHLRYDRLRGRLLGRVGPDVDWLLDYAQQLYRQVDELGTELAGWELYNDGPPARAVDSTPDISDYEEQQCP